MTKVGISLLVLRNTGNRVEVLLGKRKGSHGEGQWAMPGGHMEPLEPFIETALRELAEEVGDNFQIYQPDVVSVVNMVEYAPKHYIDIGMVAWHRAGTPVLMEPDKCEGWEWFDLNDLPSPRFFPVDKIVSSYKMKHSPSVAIVWDAE